MDVFEAIAKRHSYRGAFVDQAVPGEDLRQIVEAGLAAPSGCNAQTTSFVIVDDESLVSQIGALPGGSTAVDQARAFVVAIVDVEPPPVIKGLTFQVEDCAAAVENMLLAVTALGYATVWVDGWLRDEGRAEAIGRLLGVPDDKVVRVLLPIGTPSEKGQSPEKKPFEERAWFNRYGSSTS